MFLSLNGGSKNIILNFEELLIKDEGVALFSGTVFGFFGTLFEKGKFSEIDNLYSKLKSKYHDRFYLEIQRHGDTNEKGFEKFNLSFFLNKIKKKTIIDDKNTRGRSLPILKYTSPKNGFITT